MLAEQLVDAEAARDGYRAVAVAAIHYGHELYIENGKLRARNAALAADLRMARGMPTEEEWRDRQHLELDERRHGAAA